MAGLLAACAVVFAAGLAGTAGYALVARDKANEALHAKAEADRSAAAALSARDRADDAARDALAATGRAEEASRRATQQLVRLHIASGSNAVEAGDLHMGLLWYEKARATESTLDNPDAAHRTRFAGILGRLPIFRACFFHAEPVRQIEWHPDGRWLVTRTEGSRVAIWDTSDSAAEPQHIEATARIGHIALSADGATLATCDDAGACSLWSIPEGKPRRTPLVHPQPVRWATFHPEAPRLATACDDGRVRIWDTDSGQEIGPTLSMPGPASFVEYDRRGRNLLAAAESNHLRAFDASSGEPLGPLIPHLRRHLRFAGEQYGSTVEPHFSPDGTTVAGAWNGPFVRRTRGGESVDAIDYAEQSVRRLEWSPDGERLLVQSKTIVRWWKPGSEGVAKDRWLHPRESWVGAIHPHSALVAAASTAGKLHVWNPATGTQVIAPIQHVGEILAVRFSPDGSCIAAAGTDGTLRLWEPINLALAPQLVPDGEPDSYPRPAIASDRSRYDWVSRDGQFQMTARPELRTIAVTRRGTGEPLFEIPYPEALVGAGFTADSRLAFVRQAAELQLWDVETRKCAVERVPLHGAFVGVNSAAAGNRALVIDAETFQVYDLTAGRLLLGPVAQKANDPPAWGPADFTGYRISRGDISPDGRRVVMPGGSYRTLRSYDVDTGTALEVPLHDGLTYRAAFDRSGRRVLTAASDSTARLWDPATGRPLAPPLRHNGFVRDAALAADGRTAATYCEARERNVWLWDAETADLLLPPLNFPSSPRSARVAFSADGQRIIALYDDSSGATRTVRWTIPRFAMPVPEIPAFVELIAGRRMDDTAGPVPLLDEEVRRDRVRYRQAFLAYSAARTQRQTGPR